MTDTSGWLALFVFFIVGLLVVGLPVYYLARIAGALNRIHEALERIAGRADGDGPGTRE